MHPSPSARWEAPRWPGKSNPALILLGAVLLSAGVLLMWMGRELGFFLDDWTFLLYRRGSIDSAILNPHGENVVIGLSIVYRSLADVFGMDSVVPWRVTLVSLILLSSVLLFLIIAHARRRLPGRRRRGDDRLPRRRLRGPVLGDPDRLLHLAVLRPWRLPSTPAPDDPSRRARVRPADDRDHVVQPRDPVRDRGRGRDRAGPGPLAARLRRRRADRRLRALVARLGHEASSAISASNIVTLPDLLLEGFASSLASMLGLATPGTQEAIDAMAWGRPLLAIAVLLAAYRLVPARSHLALAARIRRHGGRLLAAGRIQRAGGREATVAATSTSAPSSSS